MSWYTDQPEEFLLCRDTGIRHGWQPYTAERVSRGYIEVLRCDRCGALKTRNLDRSGRPMKSKITYPDGFLRAGGGRLTKGENAKIRVEHLRRRLAS